MWIHMDTHDYMILTHVGAQETGPGPKLAAGPWARAWTPAHGPGPAASFGPGPGSWAPISCIHMCPCVSSTYIYICTYGLARVLCPVLCPVSHPLYCVPWLMSCVPCRMSVGVHKVKIRN